jgi:hypothetical protein
MPFPILPSGRGKDNGDNENNYTSGIDINNLSFDGNQNRAQVFQYNFGQKISNDNAKHLFSIWSNEDEVISQVAQNISGDKEERAYRVPKEISNNELLSLKAANLVVGTGDTVKITDKGKEIIKRMVLFGEKPAFNEKETVLPYSEVEKKMRENLISANKRRYR